jgi:hypothetical protein
MCGRAALGIGKGRWSNALPRPRPELAATRSSKNLERWEYTSAVLTYGPRLFVTETWRQGGGWSVSIQERRRPGRPVPVTDGVLIANGAASDTERSPVPGADLIYNGTGTDNCFAGNVFGTDFGRHDHRVYLRALNGARLGASSTDLYNHPAGEEPDPCARND